MMVSWIDETGTVFDKPTTYVKSWYLAEAVGCDDGDAGIGNTRKNIGTDESGEKAPTHVSR
jgi:hypothetical protein